MLNDSGAEVTDHVQSLASQGLLASEKLKMQRFLQWLKEQGAVFPFIKMEVKESSRTMQADARIGKGFLVPLIPRSLMITDEVAKSSKIGKLMAANTQRIDKNGYLAAYLLEAKREGGFWQPYIDVLPKDFSTHPVFFSNAELEQLQGTHALRLIKNEIKQINNEYEQIQACLPADRKFSREDYLWARCAVMSRVHHLIINKQKVRAMVPLADMPDHDAKANVRWDFEATHGFVYTSKRQIDSGEALTIDYRSTNNGVLLKIYGFCIDDELKNNRAEIELPAMPPDHPFHEYARKLGTVRKGKRAFVVSKDHDSLEARALFSYLRLSLLQDLPGIDRGKASGADEIAVGFINSSNEQNALSMLAIACQEQLQRFPTSIEEDEALLQSGNLSINLRNAVRVRHGEKRVLKYFQDYAEANMQMRG